MTKNTKRLLALLLALMLCAALLPAAALAEEDEEAGTIELVEEPEPADGTGAITPADDPEAVYTGSCGASLNWSLDTGAKVLTITGTGEMTDWTSGNPAPWYQYRSDISSVNLPSKLTSIGSYAFVGCSIRSVEIPAGVTSIGAHAFDSCSSLTSINVASGNLNYLSRDGILYDKALTTLLRFPCGKAGTFAVPNGVTRIESFAFSECLKLTGVMLPESLSSIGEGVFYLEEELNEVWFLGQAPEFDNNAFLEAYCNAYYPAAKTEFWPTSVRKNYGGQIGWTPFHNTPSFNPFCDVTGGKYYYNAVLWAYYEGITSGTSDTTFSPNATCTRAQVVTFLWNAFGKPEPDSTDIPFEDVQEGKFYTKAVLWAVEMGITSGKDATHFAPNENCTRAQVVTFLWNAFDQPEPESTNNPFLDVKEGKFYYKAVLWAVEMGITSGMDATHFGTNNTCTRGQVVTFLYNTQDSEKP